jgi:cytochrome c oxidase subunit 2
MWKTQHGNGVSEINELHVPVNTPVRLIMASQDVIHSFFVPAFRMKRDVVPGRSNETWFNATKIGMYHLFCAEYCGTDHSRMLGRIVVMSKEDFGRWLSAQPRGDALALQGAKIFRAQGCSGCHVNSTTVHAPDLKGIYGQTVQLAGGKTAIADDAYLRDSVLMPKKDVVAGYDPIMPSYQGILSDADLDSLAAYIRSLTTGDQP